MRRELFARRAGRVAHHDPRELLARPAQQGFVPLLRAFELGGELLENGRHRAVEAVLVFGGETHVERDGKRMPEQLSYLARSGGEAQIGRIDRKPVARTVEAHADVVHDSDRARPAAGSRHRHDERNHRLRTARHGVPVNDNVTMERLEPAAALGKSRPRVTVCTHDRISELASLRSSTHSARPCVSTVMASE